MDSEQSVQSYVSIPSVPWCASFSSEPQFHVHYCENKVPDYRGFQEFQNLREKNIPFSGKSRHGHTYFDHEQRNKSWKSVFSNFQEHISPKASTTELLVRIEHRDDIFLCLEKCCLKARAVKWLERTQARELTSHSLRYLKMLRCALAASVHLPHDGETLAPS